MAGKHIVIIGATSSIAEHCARLWVKENDFTFTLAGRHPDKIEQIAADLKVRNPTCTVRSVVADFTDAATIDAVVSDIASQGTIDIALIAHGSLPDQTHCQQDLVANHEALFVNGISPVLFAEAFVAPMQKANAGTIAIIGSVAGDRGRKSNYVYGSAKGLVTRYAQGLQHRLAATGVRIILIKPGPTDTPMTAHLKQQGARLASVESVAQSIVAAIEQGKPVVYAPGKWAIIMMVIRHLPRFIFNKMDI
jgi:hypothetical protein